MSSRDVLVMGGTGLVGPSLCSALVGRGYRVHVFNRGTNPGRVAPGVKLWRGDRRNVDDLRMLERIPFDVLIDTLAWFPETMPVIAAYCRARARRAILFSSVAVYAGGSDRALTEESATGANHAWGPVGRIKQMMEEAYRKCASQTLRVAILRPSHICSFEGPLGREAKLRGLLEAEEAVDIPDRGTARLQFVTPEDLGQIVLRLIDRDAECVAAYNATSSRVWTILDWVRANAHALGVRATLRFRRYSPAERHRFLYCPGDVVVSPLRMLETLHLHFPSPSPASVEIRT